MEGESTTIDSSSDNNVTRMEQNTPSSPNASSSNNDDGSHHVISSCGGADEESETDELTIDDSCVNNEDMMDDENNVAIVSSSNLHQMNDDEEEEEEDEQDEGPASSMNAEEPDAVAVVSQPLHADDENNDAEDVPMKNDNDIIKKPPNQQPAVSTSSKISFRNILKKDRTERRPQSGDGEDADVDIDSIEDAPSTISATPASPPKNPESPPSQVPVKDVASIGSPDASSSQQEPCDSAKSPSPPSSPTPMETSSSVADKQEEKVVEVSSQSSSAGGGKESSQAEVITSQENFSQFNSSQQSSNNSSNNISSQPSAEAVQSSSQDEGLSEANLTIDDEAMDTSHVETSQDGTQSSPPRASENEESQQSSIAPVSKTDSNENVPKSRTKSRSRSNTDEGEGDVDDADLEDGEIMDDDEDEPKVVPTTTTSASASSKDKKEKERERKDSKSISSSSSRSSSDKERSSRDKDKDKDRDKDKHRKDKDRKRSKREEEKEKEKDSKGSKSSSSKKRKASDAGESEQEEYNTFARSGTSPAVAIPPPASDPWSVAVEEFGDDSKVSRAKRRRESDGETSPHHHHHSGRPPREATPPGGGGGPGRRPDNRNNNNVNKRPGREERKEPKSDVICAYFMQGKCQKSAIDCTFSHDAVPPRKMELCKFWMMECCAKKEKCLYLHNDFPCKFFHTGLICKAGDRCKFSHSALSDVTKQVLLKHIETAPKEILGDFPRLNRQGAINLINKMEARMRGEEVEDDKEENIFEMSQNDHNNRGPMGPSHHDRHHGHNNHGHGHGRNDDRHGHGHGRPGRDHHGNHGHGHQQHHGPPHMNQRGNNDMRGGPGRGGGDDRHQNNNNNRNSRWEQQPSRGDQEKLHELMQEAGISGFYKDTLDTNSGPPPVSQHQGPPGPFPPMQPPLLPLNPVLMQQMLPGLLPPPNTVNNPALANVLASLNIPSTSIATPTTLAAGLPNLASAGGTASASNVPTSIATSQASESEGKSVPEHLPKMQQELFMRIQKQQQKNEKKMQNFEKSEPEEQEENWYSSEDEDDSKKKESAKSEISSKISSVLSQIRQQNQPKPSSSPVLPSSLPLPPLSESSAKTPSFYRDTDFRNASSSSFKDVDLRNPSSIFKKIDIEPAKEIDASLARNGPIPYRVKKVAGIPKIDYSSARVSMPPSTALLDPRLSSKRGNSLPAPASPTDQPASPDMTQPLTIPDGTPVFDPRTARGGGIPTTSAGGRHGPPGIPPQQNNPFLDSDNRFVSLPNPGIGMNDFPPFFNRDPRGGGPGGNPPGGSGQPPNIAAMAAAMAAMQQQLPNMQGPGGMDPLMMLGFPFMPQQPGGGVQNNLDFQQMLGPGGGPGNLRMRPPFNNQQQPPASSWERLNQGQQGQGRGDLTPPL